MTYTDGATHKWENIRGRLRFQRARDFSVKIHFFLNHYSARHQPPQFIVTMAGMLRTLAKRTAAAVAAPQRSTTPYVSHAMRAMATGPAASAKVIDDELLEKLGGLSTQALIDGLWVMGWPTSHIMGARPLTEGQKKLVGRAITIQFASVRPDIAADKPGGTESPEYEAFELVNGKEVIVMQSVGPWESVGGDIKFLRLAQRNVSGKKTRRRVDPLPRVDPLSLTPPLPVVPRDFVVPAR